MIACDVADTGQPDSTLEDLMADWALPRFDRSRDAWIVTTADQSIVGYAWGWDRVPHLDIQADLYVRPDLRDRGIEPVLLDLLEERAREHTGAVSAGAEVMLNIFTMPASNVASLLESRRYAKTRTFLRMTIDLGRGYPAPFTPAGIDIRAFRKGEDERALHGVVEESFADHFRFAPEPHDEWVARREGHPEFDPSLWLLAREGETVVGGSLSYQFGDLGWVRELGVREAWRGRGIGKALLLATFQAFHSRGQRRVSLGVDAANPSGATRLYLGVGMFEEERHDLYQLPVRSRT
jgi:mycothiol synthase